MTGHGRFNRPEPPDWRSKSEPLRRQLPTALLTMIQPVAESYRALHLRPPAGLPSNTASFLRIAAVRAHRLESGKQGTSTFEGSPV